MNNERLIILATLVMGFLVLNSNLAYAGAVFGKPANEVITGDNGVNIQPFSEPETAGYVGEVLASNDARMVELGAKIKQELKAKGQIENVEVTVEEEGAVALDGTVESEAEKIEAQKVASEIEGVNSVENRLIVQN